MRQLTIILPLAQNLDNNPIKTVSGKILLRVPPEIHSAAIMVAESEGKSLNQWAAHVLAEAANCS
jgi:predicted HicB family RNase H-like nuclease